MSKPTVTKSDKRDPRRVDVYEEFVLWSAMPPSERSRCGIKTQEQFVKLYKIGINTPTAWKKRPEYEMRVTALRQEWAFSRTGEVIESIYRSALKGNPQSQKLWLQGFTEFSEKHEVKKPEERASASVDDLLTLIEFLPEEKKKKYYDWITELLVEASIVQERARYQGDTRLDAPMPTDWKPRYTLHDSQAVEVE